VLLTIGLLAGGCTRQEQAAPRLLERPRQDAALADSTFARIIREFSEPGRFFDTDNLISNEATYLDVASTLDSLSLHRGAYVGVGPDQNFSYIARLRPEIAFLIDLRRDNLLEVLWYKALFHFAPTRIEYLSLLFGRPPPDDSPAWAGLPVDALLTAVDGAPPDLARLSETQHRIARYLAALGVGLDPDDFATIARMHQAFADQGPDLRFTTFGRPPRPCYPTYRALLAARDLTGRQASYLATEEDFRRVRRLHERNRVIPIVGDLAGPSALKRIGAYLATRALDVSAFYTSNVEFYLAQDGVLGPYLENLGSLPHDSSSVIIRSIFDFRFVSPPLPPATTGACSVQRLQHMAALLAFTARGGAVSYGDLVSRAPIELR
jgi:hypothetical protein